MIIIWIAKACERESYGKREKRGRNGGEPSSETNTTINKNDWSQKQNVTIPRRE